MVILSLIFVAMHHVEEFIELDLAIFVFVDFFNNVFDHLLVDIFSKAKYFFNFIDGDASTLILVEHLKCSP